MVVEVCTDIFLTQIAHIGIGYVLMYDDLIKDDSDNPTIDVLLCTDTDIKIAKYSVLHNSEQLFASKYMAYSSHKKSPLKLNLRGLSYKHIYLTNTWLSHTVSFS